MAQTGSRKRGRATATDSVNSDEPNNSKRPNTTKKATRATTTRDVGKNGSRGAVKSTKQGRKGAIDAIDQIRAKGDEVLLAIEGERRKFADSRSGRTDGTLADSLASACALHSHDPLAGCPAFDEAKRALQRFQSIAHARYDTTATGQVPSLAEPRWMRWKQDVVDLTALNSKARKLAQQIAEGHLAPTGWPELVAPQEEQHQQAGATAEDEELAQIAMEILDEAVPKGGAATWGAAAAQLLDVYGRMLKDTF